jgi:hypothetical protein
MGDAKIPLNILKMLQVTLHTRKLFSHARTRIEENTRAFASLGSSALFLFVYSRNLASPSRHDRPTRFKQPSDLGK